MRVVVTHLTRMRRGFICAAGIDLHTGGHVRLLPRGRELGYPDLAAHGGLFEIGSVLDVGYAIPRGQPPETEDHEFVRRISRRVENLDGAQLWKRMKGISKTALVEIFGQDLKPIGHEHAAVEPGFGQVSLGVLSIYSDHRPELVIEHHDRRDRIRIKLRTGRVPLNLSVTDVRLYGADHVTPDPAAVESAQERLAASAEILLSVGLTRAYSDWLSDQPPLHWLQVNNLHFVENPFWNLTTNALPA